MSLSNKVSALEKKAKKLSRVNASFDKYCEVVGFDLNLVSNLNHPDENLENVAVDMMIGATRKSIALIYFRSLAILNSKLEAYFKGERIYPVEDIRNLKILFDIYNAALGYTPLSNIDSALRTVQAVPGFSVNVDKNANLS